MMPVYSIYKPSTFRKTLTSLSPRFCPFMHIHKYSPPSQQYSWACEYTRRMRTWQLNTTLQGWMMPKLHIIIFCLHFFIYHFYNLYMWSFLSIFLFSFFPFIFLFPSLIYRIWMQSKITTCIYPVSPLPWICAKTYTTIQKFKYTPLGVLGKIKDPIRTFNLKLSGFMYFSIYNIRIVSKKRASFLFLDYVSFHISYL